MAIRAVFFDLDNTLLRNDGDAFLEDFLVKFGEALVGREGQEAFRQAALLAGLALMEDHPEATNHEVLVAVLSRELSLPSPYVEQTLRAFGQDVGSLGGPWAPIPEAREVVRRVHSLGLKTVLATAPIYLEGPVRERMRRARVDDLPWDLITTSDVMHAMKPKPAYFLEAASLVAVRPEECLMVGDDPFQDLEAGKVGFATYYVGEGYPGLAHGPGGSLASLVPWLLPQLSLPAT